MNKEKNYYYLIAKLTDLKFKILNGKICKSYLIHLAKILMFRVIYN